MLHHHNITFCPKAEQCVGVDYDRQQQACHAHNKTTSCASLKPLSQAIHYSKITCGTYSCFLFTFQPDSHKKQLRGPSSLKDSTACTATKTHLKTHNFMSKTHSQTSTASNYNIDGSHCVSTFKCPFGSVIKLAGESLLPCPASVWFVSNVIKFLGLFHIAAEMYFRFLLCFLTELASTAQSSVSQYWNSLGDTANLDSQVVFIRGPAGPPGPPGPAPSLT